jgi:flagellar biosynthesis/type III secretory pathway chaperone
VGGGGAERRFGEQHSTDASPSPHALLQLEIAGYKALLRLLDGECDALRRVDADAIENTSAAKHAQVQALEQLARVREDQLRARGLPVSAAGVALWLADGDDASAVDASWSTLLDLARAARAANARNGKLMARQRRHYDGALAALLQAAGVPSVYGADGRPQAATVGRALAAI